MRRMLAGIGYSIVVVVLVVAVRRLAPSGS